MRPKILIDTRFWQPKHGGLSKYSQGLILALNQLKTNFDYIILTESQTPKLGNNFKVIATKTKHYSLKEQLTIPFYILKSKPDLIHFLHFNLPIIKPPIKFVVTIHDLIKDYFTLPVDTSHNKYIFKFKRAAYKLTIKRAIYSANHIITPTQTVKNQILSRYKQVKSDKITPIYEGCWQNQARPVMPKGFQLDKPYLLYVGSLYQHKNVIFLLKHLDTIKSNGFELVIVTPKAATGNWRKILETNRVNYYHNLPETNLNWLYQNCYALVSASLMEGFGLPVIEAMTYNKPVLISNIPAFLEITHNQTVYFDPHQPDSFAKALYQLKSNYHYYQKVSANLKNYYSFSTMATKTLDVYKKLLSI